MIERGQRPPPAYRLAKQNHFPQFSSMNTLTLDHLAVSGENRDAARAHIEDALGLPMQASGVHKRFGTHNHLMGLDDGLYLEAISIDPSAPKPDRPRWFDLDNFVGKPRLTNWICAVPDMAQAVKHWRDAGGPVVLERGDLKWQMAVPEDGKLPFNGLFPPLIAWAGTLHPAQMLTASGARLVCLTVQHPQADDLADLLGSINGVKVRFEAANTTALVAEFETPHGLRTLT